MAEKLKKKIYQISKAVTWGAHVPYHYNPNSFNLFNSGTNFWISGQLHPQSLQFLAPGFEHWRTQAAVLLLIFHKYIHV